MIAKTKRSYILPVERHMEIHNSLRKVGQTMILLPERERPKERVEWSFTPMMHKAVAGTLAGGFDKVGRITSRSKFENHYRMKIER